MEMVSHCELSDEVDELICAYIQPSGHITTADLIRDLAEKHRISHDIIVKLVSRARKVLSLDAIDEDDVRWHLDNRLNSKDVREMLGI